MPDAMEQLAGIARSLKKTAEQGTLELVDHRHEPAMWAKHGLSTAEVMLSVAEEAATNGGRAAWELRLQLAGAVSAFVLSPVFAAADLAESISEPEAGMVGAVDIAVKSGLVGTAVVSKYMLVRTFLLEGLKRATPVAGEAAIAAAEGAPSAVAFFTRVSLIGTRFTAATFVFGLSYALSTVALERPCNASGWVVGHIPVSSEVDAVEYPKSALYNALSAGEPLSEELAEEITEGLERNGADWPSYDQYPGWLKTELNERTIGQAREFLRIFVDDFNAVEQWLGVDLAEGTCVVIESDHDTESASGAPDQQAWSPVASMLASLARGDHEQSRDGQSVGDRADEPPPNGPNDDEVAQQLAAGAAAALEQHQVWSPIAPLMAMIRTDSGDGGDADELSTPADDAHEQSTSVPPVDDSGIDSPASVSQDRVDDAPGAGSAPDVDNPGSSSVAPIVSATNTQHDQGPATGGTPASSDIEAGAGMDARLEPGPSHDQVLLNNLSQLTAAFSSDAEHAVAASEHTVHVREHVHQAVGQMPAEHGGHHD